MYKISGKITINVRIIAKEVLKLATADDRIVRFNTNRVQGMKQVEAYAKAFDLGDDYNRKQAGEQASRYAKRKDVQENYKKLTAEVSKEIISSTVNLRLKIINQLEELFDIACGKKEDSYCEKEIIEGEEMIVAQGSKLRTNPKVANEIAANIAKLEGFNNEKSGGDIQQVVIIDDLGKK